MRRIIGFIGGMVAALALMALVFGGSGYTPRGGGWGVLVIAAGGLGARFAANPKAIAKPAVDPLRKRWWGLSMPVRLGFFGGALWIAGALLFIDSYDQTFQNTVAPALAIVVAGWAYRRLILGAPSVSVEQEDE